jgi:uncharacterized protein YndB with AHSA1/START domain
MKLNLKVERLYPEPPEVVWNAIATSEGLAAWLMPNDFKPVVGHQFTFSFCAPNSEEETSHVYAEVIELDPPWHMVWSWRNETEDEATRVTFTLTRQNNGTLLQLDHFGPVPDFIGSELTKGWPTKLDVLKSLIGQR